MNYELTHKMLGYLKRRYADPNDISGIEYDDLRKMLDDYSHSDFDDSLFCLRENGHVQHMGHFVITSQGITAHIDRYYPRLRWERLKSNVTFIVTVIMFLISLVTFGYAQYARYVDADKQKALQLQINKLNTQVDSIVHSTKTKSEIQ